MLSAGSDGIDGNTQNAGAIADPTTGGPRPRIWLRPRTVAADIQCLSRCSRRLGDAVVTGPTGHNLRDLRLLIAANVSYSTSADVRLSDVSPQRVTRTRGAGL